MKNRFLIPLCIFIFSPLIINAQLRLPELIDHGMVLQRNAEVPIYGWASPKDMVQISFLDSIYYTRANEIGEWSLYLYNLEAGGPHDMIFSADTAIIIRDIMIGDVWVCSGQSQMDMDMNRVRPLYEEEINEAGNQFIRYFEVPGVYNFEGPQKDISHGNWESISPEGANLYNKEGLPAAPFRTDDWNFER